MSMPISERVLEAVLAQLQTITVANGYHTDAGTSVVRTTPGSVLGALPAMVLVETSEVPSGGAASDRVDNMTIALGFDVELHGKPDAGETAKWLGHARADVKRAVLGWARGLIGPPGRGVRDADGGIAALFYLGADIVTSPPAAVTAAVTVKFSATYREGYGDPSEVL